ncbi:transcriptional regulator, LysR family [Actinomycetales bacterium JB111]|nr:transcriptional regulator, LysR family [Actinomycetales bacterium JB111]
MIALRDLHQFVILAEELNFRAAASRLHVSQPTLSETVKRIERTIGGKLLERTTRRSRLTPAGQALYEGAQHLLRDAEALTHEVRSVAAGMRREFRIGAVNPAMRTLVPSVLRQLHEQFPGIRLSLHPMSTHEQLRAMREGRLDVAVVRTAVQPRETRSHFLVNEPLFAVLPAGHELEPEPLIELPRLRDHTFIMAPRDRNPEFYDALVALYKSRGSAPDEILVAANMHAQLTLVGAGIGVAVQPLLFIDRDRSDVVFRPTPERLDVPLQVLTPSVPDVLADAFVDAADRQIRQLMERAGVADR